jgi:CrcB protein
MIKYFIIVGLGGAVGSMLRYGLFVLTKSTSFPWVTLFINISGSLLIGIIMALSAKHADFPVQGRLFLATGLCGGFTTFSAFSYDNLQLIQNGKIMMALLYIGLSVLCSLAAVFLGYKLAA